MLQIDKLIQLVQFLNHLGTSNSGANLPAHSHPHFFSYQNLKSFSTVLVPKGKAELESQKCQKRIFGTSTQKLRKVEIKVFWSFPTVHDFLFSQNVSKL